MSNPQTPAPFHQRPIFTRAVILWSMLGTLSAGYLGMLVFAPDWLDDLTPSAAPRDPQSNQGQRAAARLAADLNGLRDSISKVQLDLAKVKTEIDGVHERDKTLTGHVARLEQQLANQAGNKVEAAAPPDRGQPEAATKLDTTHPQMIRTEAAAKAIAVPAAPKLINADTAPDLTTGQIIDPNALQPPADPAVNAALNGIDLGPAVVKPAPKPLGVKLSSGASVDALRLSWSLLSERHGEALKNLEARYVIAGDAQSPSYDLVAGPFKSNAAAKKLCKALAANNVPCKIGDFGGESL
jgi:hypothetical protein